MSVLILGGDRIDHTRKVLNERGVESILHWTSKNRKNGRRQDRCIPSKVQIVVMLTNFFNHNSMKHYKEKAKSRGLPAVYSRRNVKCANNEFIKMLHPLDTDSNICIQCRKFTTCCREEE